MINVIAKFTAKKDLIEETKTTLQSLIPPTQKDEGYVQYDLHQDLNNPQLFFMYETWENEEALNKHLSTPHLTNFVEKANEILEIPMEVSILKKLN